MPAAVEESILAFADWTIAGRTFRPFYLAFAASIAFHGPYYLVADPLPIAFGQDAGTHAGAVLLQAFR